MLLFNASVAMAAGHDAQITDVLLQAGIAKPMQLPEEILLIFGQSLSQKPFLVRFYRMEAYQVFLMAFKVFSPFALRFGYLDTYISETRKRRKQHDHDFSMASTQRNARRKLYGTHK